MQTFILRIVHKESGIYANAILGKNYSVQKGGEQYGFNNAWGAIVGDGENVYPIHSNDYEYYVMTGSGETFEKINLYKYSKQNPKK